MRALRAAVPFAVAAHLSCGGGAKGTGPSTVPNTTGLAAGTVITLLSGETGAPVSTASVTAGGQVSNSDAAGEVRLPSPAALGTSIEIRHPSVLDRISLVRTGTPQRFLLWPRTNAAGLSENYTALLVYTDTTDPPGPTGESALQRLPVGTTSVVVVPSEDMLGDAGAMDALRQGVGAINQATAGAVTYALSPTRPASGVVVSARVDTQDNRCVEGNIRAYTRSTYTGLSLTRAEIILCSWAVAQSATVGHELGHTFGLRHSPDDRELMYFQFGSRRATTFGARESLLMRLMLERPPGNRYPDDDRTAIAASARTERVTVCY
jgi:hypothetical protein